MGMYKLCFRGYISRNKLFLVNSAKQKVVHIVWGFMCQFSEIYKFSETL